MAAMCTARCYHWLIVALLTGGAVASAQSFRRGSMEFYAQREVLVPVGKGIGAVVVEFLHHGQIAPDGRNVAVVSRSQQVVPSRVLQLGPGDYCRLAFQTLPAQPAYQVLYGGPPLPEGTVPAWTYRDGLLLETRQFRRCDLNSAESVQAAFQEAQPIGADYVDGIMHACNPFSLVQEGFLSRYSGTLHIAGPDLYGFFLSTQDCGFMLIDGKMVVSTPGHHPPLRHARPDARTNVRLTPGPHRFEFYHAAARGEAMMAVTWEVSPGTTGGKPQVERIPSEVWKAATIAHLPVEPMTTRESRLLPDFTFRIEGDVPLPDNPLALVRVAFQDRSPKALTMKGRVLWEFGDGQTSEQAEPMHVYLKPGLYTVKLSVGRAPRSITTANRIYVDRPLILDRRPKLDVLDDYLPMLTNCNPAALDASSLRQLVAAFEAKAGRLESPPDDAESDAAARPRRRRAKQAESAPVATADVPAEVLAERWAEARRWLAQAVAAGKAAFLSSSPADGNEALLALARSVGPLARDRLGDSELAFKIWDGAVRKIKTPELRAACAIEAADVAVNDLGNLPAARTLLDGAKSILGDGRKGSVASALARVWGDYCAATGDGKSARQAYAEAERVLITGKTLIEQNAWRGAHNRSAEEFLQTGEFDRAALEIHAWQREFPGEKTDGQVTFMHARYWAGREKYDRAIALSNQLLTVNADSPCADQMLMLAATCEWKRGNAKAASATLHSLLKDYPGSPLVPEAKAGLQRLAAGEPLERPGRRVRKQL
jgi:TolA-binding protein